jgi:hypothetical protein
MTPIVRGLEDEFGDQVVFVYLNALDSADGQQTFAALNLPGHPGYVLFTPDGVEVYRAFGIVEADALRFAIENALNRLVTTDEP